MIAQADIDDLIAGHRLIERLLQAERRRIDELIEAAARAARGAVVAPQAEPEGLEAVAPAAPPVPVSKPEPATRRLSAREQLAAEHAKHGPSVAVHLVRPAKRNKPLTVKPTQHISISQEPTRSTRKPLTAPAQSFEPEAGRPAPKVTKVKGWTHDPRYSLGPGEKVDGAGFVAEWRAKRSGGR